MSTTVSKPRTPIWLWPISLLWKLVTVVSNRVGIIATLGMGAALTFVGYVLIASLIGALIGVPLFVLGLFMLARGLY